MHLYTVRLRSLRPFRFGVMNFGSSLDEWHAFARRAEDLGFSTLVVSDHFGKQLAPLPALMAAAGVTTRIRLGTIVLDNDFRHPALLAKEAATISLLTSGRFELGIGAGWLEADYTVSGLPFDPPGIRFARLRESVAILKGFFSGETLTFAGQHYRVRELACVPKPVGPLPLMIGGRQRHMLSFAAREADIVSISLLDRQPNPPTFAQKIAWVREAAGARLAEIELHVNVNVVDTSAPPEWPSAPNRLIGGVGALCDQLHYWRDEFGVSYFAVNARVMDAIAPVVERLAGR
jgi:probable F420-dependent oxidoreductase